MELDVGRQTERFCYLITLRNVSNISIILFFRNTGFLELDETGHTVGE